MRREAIPVLGLVELMLQRPMQLTAYEDNTATITAIRVGYSPALRYLERTARVSLGVTHELFFPDEPEEDFDPDPACPGGVGFVLQPKLTHCPTAEMRADIFTKVLDRQKFAAALLLINCKGELCK